MAKGIEKTDAHRIYGPYISEKTNQVAWYVIPAHGPGKKRVFRSKMKMLEFVDVITTDLKK